MTQVTHVLSAIEQGDSHAAEQLLPLVYDQLRKLAAHKLNQEAPGQTLQATALVHEAYLRLVGQDKAPHWDSRGHFFAAAAEAMRRILVERARAKAGTKQGGGRRRVVLDEGVALTERPPEEVLALHEALADLEKVDPLKAQIVNLRYFTGMTLRETAAVLGLSERTAHRHWRFLKAWLKSRLGETG
jgi:RNA polymerase sigma factor (TIGR02999 family)